ncbi:MAG: hypothetical protein O4808_14210 [Trichodesmium sp. St17_bin3_1_1]|jgi:hypothetical protein|nr:hypothetical protein [Trichodesmium sp. MAG_R02]MDE5108162.1 hypothetical protein [Trichodesmium sp. St17_bin3_1_1]
MANSYTFYYSRRTGEKFNDLVSPNIDCIISIEGDRLSQEKIESYVKKYPTLEYHIRNDLGNALQEEESQRK